MKSGSYVRYFGTWLAFNMSMHRVCLFLMMVLASIAGNFAFAGSDAFPGYVSDVIAEKDERFYEIYLFNNPPAKETDLKDRIFNADLSKEFKERYREKFGELDTSSISYQIAYKEDNFSRYSVQTEEEYAKRKSFAEYMTRRVLEWHVDNYIKSEPAMRPIYETKERLSNIEVKVSKESKLDFKYSFAGNIMDIIYDNPWVDSKLSLEMDPSAFGPTGAQEQKLYLGKEINKKLYIKNTTAFNDGITGIEFIRQLKANWAASFGNSVNFKGGGTSPRESRLALGVSHSY